MPTEKERGMHGTGPIAGLAALHDRFPLAGTPPNALLAADPALLGYLRSVLREAPAPPPERSTAEWRAFLPLLDAHALRPLLAHRVLRQPVPLRPPADVAAGLREELLRSAAAALREDRVLAELLERLGKVGVVPLLLKGAALARSVYPDPAVRPGADIDLLVREEELAACGEAVTALGYRAPYDFHAFSRFTTPHQVYLPLQGTPGAKPLELHWGLGQGFAQDPGRLDGLFSRSIAVRYPAFAFRTLSPVDHLAFCAHHALYHHGNGVRLGWIVDLAQLCRALGPADRAALPARAAEHRSRIATEAGLRMASAWTGTLDPADACFFDGWPEPSRAELAAWHRVAREGSSRLRVLRMQLHFIPSSAGKARYLAGSVFPPRGKMRFDCPGSSSPHRFPGLGSTYLYHWLRYWRHR